MAPHRPRAVIGHDGCIGKDGAGIAGLWYLEAIGIPAAAADGMTAELGNGIDLYETGVISRVNILAERAGVKEGMTVSEAAEMLIVNDPGDISAGTKIRRESMATSDSGGRLSSRILLSSHSQKIQTMFWDSRTYRPVRSQISSRGFANGLFVRWWNE